MKIYVIGQEAAYVRMFVNNGWTPVGTPEEADAIQFTGGADVDPSFYGEQAHPRTYSNPARDDFEQDIFDQWFDKPKFGICRGSQFLCVMNGGSLWQDVDNHAIGGTHKATILSSGEKVQVSSTHHQMMNPTGTQHTVLMSASLSTRKDTGNGSFILDENNGHDVEACYWPVSKSLGYQPHPEFFNPDHECQKTYFKLIEEKFNLKGNK